MTEPYGIQQRWIVFCGAIMLASAALLVLLAGRASGQVHRNLFQRAPTPAQPGAHGVLAQESDVDATIAALPRDQITIALPGRPDLFLERHSHERRGQRNLVWRGRLPSDRKSNATLTFHEGLAIGRIETGHDIYVVRPGQNGRAIIEKLDPTSFAPEWGHDHATHGREMVPSAGDLGSQDGAIAPALAFPADGATTEIVLMSVYTPQARSAAGGASQIRAKIQAAVDQANTAFINSNMAVRYFLAHMQEVSYNDSGNIDADLNWVTSSSSVASLRNSYAADMVSLIVGNGGPYCGVGWIQRSPSPGFANYAFQVTVQDCLFNGTLAHEHGHNLGMEHDPPNAGIAPSGASYPWSFGHSVNGSFRTIMAYDGCSSGCPRVLHFSNPDVLYNGVPTGVKDQRDNAWTGDLVGPLVASFRAGGGSADNAAPVFASDPIVKPDATQGVRYSATLSGDAGDPDGDVVTFAKLAGPAWLSIASNGTLSGTPASTDAGWNTFTVSVSDGKGGSDTATLQISVATALPSPANLTAIAAGPRQIDLTWTDNSNGEQGFKIERSTDGVNFRQVGKVRAGVTRFSNRRLKTGTTYYYRVRAYYRKQHSAYSNSSAATVLLVSAQGAIR